MIRNFSLVIGLGTIIHVCGECPYPQISNYSIDLNLYLFRPCTCGGDIMIAQYHDLSVLLFVLLNDILWRGEMNIVSSKMFYSIKSLLTVNLPLIRGRVE